MEDAVLQPIRRRDCQEYENSAMQQREYLFELTPLPDEHLVEMPIVTGPWRSSTQPIGVGRTTGGLSRN
ncbi:hypothetical protein B2J88_42300 [Rhodococcus sp. SRB_17]|nr:hypothetical protein [Rhodococcus sp. SRB_17]